MLGTSPVSSRWIASRIASARALKAASDLWNKDNQYDSFCTRWGCARGQEHERKRQKRGKDAPVVVVLSPKHVDVEGDARGLRERLEHVRDHLGREVANLFPLQLQVAAEVGSRGDVEDGAREGLHPIQADGISHSAQKEANRYRERGGTHLVERGKAGAVPPDPSPFTERELERLADRERAVLGRVVVVDFQVALALDLERHAAVLGESVKHLHPRDRRRSPATWSAACVQSLGVEGKVKVRTHVVQEADASVDFNDLLGVRSVVESDGALDVGLARLARDTRRADTLRVVASHLYCRCSLTVWREESNLMVARGAARPPAHVRGLKLDFLHSREPAMCSHPLRDA